MRVCVLGATEVWRGDQPVDLGTRKQRALVAALALASGRPVPVDTIVDLLWADTPPASVANTLQAYVSGLRRALEPDRATRAPATVLVTVAPGYALRVPDDRLDTLRFDHLVSGVHRRLGARGTWWESPALSDPEVGACLAELDEALSLWRGTPYVDLDDAAAVTAERARLEELRSVALEDRAVLRLALGDHGTVAGELESLTSAYPLRERLWGLRAVALARAGRQADALDALQELRDVLDRELGLEPSAELRDLLTAVLRQDPEIVSRAARPAATPRPPDWPLVGRDNQLAVLTEALASANGGTPRFAVLTGDPGIGKSRLCGELASRAVAEGARVVVGRCSQDDGAPPLWPWRQVLRGLGVELEVPDADDEGAEFRTWEAITAHVVRSARDETLVVMLDDLHWADRSSLRVLRLLTETASTERLLVAGTWRTHPEPTGALADAAEALARRHAARLELTGLSPAQAAEVVEAVTEVAPTAEQAGQLAERTDGNPFFLVEYARLAQDRGDLGALLAEANPPTAVSDVLARRIDRLPTGSSDLLSWAGVIGRSFELPVLIDAAGIDEDEALDHIEAALAAGLVREEGVGSYVFGHALVRDELYGGLGPTRRSRMHARVAEALDATPGRESETARHWLDAGPAYAGQAWRAARAAAETARRVHAYGEVAELLEAALDALELDPTATAADRYDLLMPLADAHRWRAAWEPLHLTVQRAIAAADELGDIERLASAASSMTIGALWQSAPYGMTHDEVIAALRRSLAGLPAADGEMRCRVMLALANELYYTSSFEERAALVEQAVAMADRLAVDDLQIDARQIGSVSLWQPDTAELRYDLAREAMERAEASGNERGYAAATALVTVVLGELGRIAEMWDMFAIARERAEKLQFPYGLLVLDSLEVPWLAMAGRADEAEERVERLGRLIQDMSMRHADDAWAGSMLTLRFWEGRTAEVVPIMQMFEGGPMPVTPILLHYLLKGGQEEAAREYAVTHPLGLGPTDWMAMLNWGCAAQAALGLADRAVAAEAYAALAPYAGRTICAGSGNSLGPVDAALAHAAAAVGDVELAARHADDALRLMEEWRIPLAAQWLRDQRERYGF